MLEAIDEVLYVSELVELQQGGEHEVFAVFLIDFDELALVLCEACKFLIDTLLQKHLNSENFYLHKLNVEFFLALVLQIEPIEKGDKVLVATFDHCRQQSFLKSRQCFPLKEPLRLVEVILKGYLVGDVRLYGTILLWVGEDLAALDILIRRDSLHLDQLGSPVGLSPEVRQLLRRILDLVVEGPLLVHMYQVLLLFCRGRFVKINLANLDQILDIVRNLVSGCDLFRELPLVDHPLAPEQRKHKHVALHIAKSYEKRGGGVHFDGMEGVEELDPIELEDELPEYLLGEEGGALAAVEEDYPEELAGLAAGHLRHEQLKVVDVELAVQQLLLARWVLAAGHLAHVLLAADLAPRPLVRALLLYHDLKLPAPRVRHQLLKTGPRALGTPEPLDLRMQVEGLSDEIAEGIGPGLAREHELSPAVAVGKRD